MPQYKNISSFFFPKQLLKAEEHSWSLAELVHAVVLLTHYHSLASFTFGCGISPEIHCDGGHTFRPPSVSNYCICDITNGNHSVEENQVNSAGNVLVSILFVTGFHKTNHNNCSYIIFSVHRLVLNPHQPGRSYIIF